MSVEVDTLELEVFEVSPPILSRTRRTEVARWLRQKRKDLPEVTSNYVADSARSLVEYILVLGNAMTRLLSYNNLQKYTTIVCHIFFTKIQICICLYQLNIKNRSFEYYEVN